MSQPRNQERRTLLPQANQALRQGNYVQAIAGYARFLAQQPESGKTISANLTLARKKYHTSRAGIEKPHVGVCGWGLAHNPAGRG